MILYKLWKLHSSFIIWRWFRIQNRSDQVWGFPDRSVGKESASNAGDLGLILGLGTSPGEGKGYPLQYCGLENFTDCVVHGVSESDMTERLSLSLFKLGFPGGSVVKNSYVMAGDVGSIHGSGRSTGEGIGYPLQYSWAFLVAQLVKNPPAVQKTWDQSLGW